MNEKINLWSFILSLVCIFLTLLVGTTRSILYFFTEWIGIHPINIVLFITVITFLFGVFGLAGVRDWQSILRSTLALIITGSLSVILAYIIFIGGLLSE